MCSALVVIFSNSERSRWPPPPEPNESYNRPHRLNSKSYNNKHIGARAHHSYSPLSLVLLLRIVLPRSWSSSRAPTSFFLLSCVRCSFFYLFFFLFGTDIMSEVYLFYVFLSNHILYVDFDLCEPFCGKMVALSSDVLSFFVLLRFFFIPYDDDVIRWSGRCCTSQISTRWYRYIVLSNGLVQKPGNYYSLCDDFSPCKIFSWIWNAMGTAT